MILSITATNYLGESVKFTLDKPDETGIYVKKVDGLGPVTANINTTELSSNDGSVFNSARLNSRNIVLTFGLMFNPIVEDMRHKLYKFFPLKKPVRIDVETDRRKLYTIGYTETNNPDIFAKEETQQVSIICPTPWMYGITESQDSSELYKVTKAFRFPFPIEGDTFEFGTIESKSSVNIEYDGDDDTGVRLELHFLGTVEAPISIHNNTSNETLTVDITKTPYIQFRQNDTLQISTVRGNKYVRLMREHGDNFQNAINMLDRNSSWIALHHGDNEIAMTSTSQSVLSLIQVKIDYDILYSGV